MRAHIQATKDYCKFCFQTLQAKLRKQKLPSFPNNLEDLEVPLFVTWTIGEELRGCIGTFEPEKLSKILAQYTLISALEDDRFDPISLEEFPSLGVSVSFLVNFTPNVGVYDWEIGRHGIILELRRNGKLYSATFLPEVAEQEKWDKKNNVETFNAQVVEKDIKITTYESSKSYLTYEDWQKEKLGLAKSK